ncbi:MAG: response regulator [Lachnospiraceae bacterium]|nr:response regulator [Lachnospiraceae bacterium]
MKKVLLIGELNQTVSNLNNYLLDYYHTQICADNTEIVKGMVKVSKPNIIIICLVGVGEVDKKMLDFFKNEIPTVPVLLVGTGDECKYYQNYFEEEQFDFLLRPTTQTALLQKCNEMLNGGESEPEEEVVTVQTEYRKKRIMIVDDSPILLRSIKSILDNKYEVMVATSGEKALPLIKKKQPDLILLDYEMPEWDGKKTLEEIRKDEEIMDVPVMFLTGVAEKEYIAAVLGLNPAGYLLKPVEQSKLLKTIEEVLGVC